MDSVLLVELIVAGLGVLAVAVGVVVSIVRRRRRGPEEPPVEESGPGSIKMYPGAFWGHGGHWN